jgi:hypothetical protein
VEAAHWPRNYVGNLRWVCHEITGGLASGEKLHPRLLIEVRRQVAAWPYRIGYKQRRHYYLSSRAGHEVFARCGRQRRFEVPLSPDASATFLAN